MKEIYDHLLIELFRLASSLMSCRRPSPLPPSRCCCSEVFSQQHKSPWLFFAEDPQDGTAVGMNLSCNDDNGIILFRVISSHALNPHAILQRERESEQELGPLENRTGVAAKDVLLNVNQMALHAKHQCSPSKDKSNWTEPANSPNLCNKLASS